MAEMSLEEVPTAAGVPAVPAHHAQLRAELVRAVRRVCPAWLAQDAEDLVQDAMIRLMQRNERSANTLVVSAGYLKKVAYCTVVDEIRRRQRRADQMPAGVETDDLADEAPAIGDPLIGNAIAQCLELQNPERRRALTLHLLGHSVAEAANILGCNAKRAENLVYRGLAQLRDCLSKRGIRP